MFLDAELEVNCAICFERPQDTRLEPCGHTDFCRPCVEGLQICPLCRKPIDAVLPASTLRKEPVHDFSDLPMG